jgi:hypothetical protein
VRYIHNILGGRYQRSLALRILATWTLMRPMLAPLASAAAVHTMMQWQRASHFQRLVSA